MSAPSRGRAEITTDGGVNFAGNEAGVLLLHGLGGTPNELKPLAWGLSAAGYTVHLPRLPGHGGTEADLLASHRGEWRAAVVGAAERLRRSCRTVVAGGLSMGAILALALALDEPELVDGLALLAPTLRHDGWSVPRTRVFLTLLAPLLGTPLGRWYRFVERHPFGVKDERVRARLQQALASGSSTEAGLLGTPARSLREFARLVAEVEPWLRAVTAPTLIVHPREDDISDLRSAFRLQRELGGRVECLVLEDSYHLITVDRQRDLVTERAIAFVEQVSGLAARRAASPTRVGAVR